MVTGCAVQIAPERWAGLPGVARVLGNAEKLEPGHWVPGAPGAVADIRAARAHRAHAVAGLAGSLLLVAGLLFLAVRSWRLVVPIVLTLVLGLLLTTGFATVTSSPLNLISVAFAILFVGIAVDFAIQFAVRLREEQLHEPALLHALAGTARRAGLVRAPDMR